MDFKLWSIDYKYAPFSITSSETSQLEVVINYNDYKIAAIEKIMAGDYSIADAHDKIRILLAEPNMEPTYTYV